MTAVRTREDDSSAARIPAPPAPTMTTSYWWTCMSLLGGCRSGGAERREQLGRRSGRARVERKDDERAEHGRQDERGDEEHLEDDPRAVLLGVVVDDRAHAVAAVDHREPQHEQVPDPPPDVGPLAGDEAEVDARDAVTGDEVDEQVAEDQHDEDDARDPHEEPRGHLGVAARRAARRPRRSR